MSVGDAIFLSAALLGLVALFIATKDRWNWKRISKFAIGLPVLLIAITGFSIWGYTTFRDRPQLQREFWGIPLTATRADVRFMKGEPSEITELDWVYYIKDNTSGNNIAAHVIRWEPAGTVRYVMYATSSGNFIHPSLQGFQVDSSYASIISELGSPDHVSTSTDGLSRMLSYAKYQTFYIFEQAKLKSYGTYSPASGPREFTIVPPPKSPASSASMPKK